MRSAAGSWSRRVSNGRFVASRPLENRSLFGLRVRSFNFRFANDPLGMQIRALPRVAAFSVKLARDRLWSWIASVAGRSRERNGSDRGESYAIT